MSLPVEIISLTGALLLFFRSKDDLKLIELISNNKTINFARLIFKLNLFFLTSYLVCGTLIFFVFDSYEFFNFTKILLALGCIFGLAKRFFSLFNYGLESHYFGLAELSLLSISMSLFYSAQIFTSTVLISSISAGISKLKCDLWTKKDASGMIRFCSQPWLTRFYIRKFSRKLYKLENFKKIYKLVTFITPWCQILSAIIIILSRIFEINIFLVNCSIFFQILFGVLLFVLTGLGWIPFIYLWLSITFLNLNFTSNTINFQPQFDLNSSSTLFSTVFLILYTCNAIGNIKNKIFRSISKWSSNLTLNCGNFAMFTDRNSTNMISHYFVSSESRSITNVFSNNGERDISQDFCARHLFDLIYPLGDFVQKTSKAEKKVPTFKSEFNKKQCMNIFKAIKNGKIKFFQHKWDYIKGTYVSVHIANLLVQTNKENNEINLSFHQIEKILPMPKR